MSMGAKSFDSLAFSLPAGRYDIESYVSVCLGCGRGMHPQDKCGAAVEIAAGETLYAERIENGKECTVVTSSKPFR
jgi:hypothetical protein